MTEAPDHIKTLARQTTINIVNGLYGCTADTALNRVDHLAAYKVTEETLVRALMEAVNTERHLLADALRKFAPDLSEALTVKWRDAQNALPDFLAFLRKGASR